MQVKVTARRFKMSKKIKEYAEKEVLKVNKYYQNIIDTEIILSWEKNERIAELNILVNNKKVSAHEKSKNMTKSIDVCVEKIIRQLKKYKERSRKFDHENVTRKHLIDITRDSIEATDK